MVILSFETGGIQVIMEEIIIFFLRHLVICRIYLFYFMHGFIFSNPVHQKIDSFWTYAKKKLKKENKNKRRGFSVIDMGNEMYQHFLGLSFDHLSSLLYISCVDTTLYLSEHGTSRNWRTQILHALCACVFLFKANVHH